MPLTSSKDNKSPTQGDIQKEPVKMDGKRFSLFQGWPSMFNGSDQNDVKDGELDKYLPRKSDEINKRFLKAKKEFIDTVFINNKMTGRKSKGPKAKRFVLYPDDKIRTRWEAIISM